jgi:biopolymer transport protein TolQ
MTTSPTFWNFITHADPVVKTVILILILASFISWTLIIQRTVFLRHLRRELKQFEHLFWSGSDITHLYEQLSQKREELFGISNIFYVGFSEFLRLYQQTHKKADIVLIGAQRAMRVAQSHEIDFMERNLPVLATIGSTSPYIGLFGTVWGIMSSFRALGGLQQATLAVVAPGISEALIATAIGLFAAIPAVIAYNRLSYQTERLIQNYGTFQEELSNLLQYKYPLSG